MNIMFNNINNEPNTTTLILVDITIISSAVHLFLIERNYKIRSSLTITLFFEIAISTTQSSYLKYRATCTIIDHISLTPIVASKSAILYSTCQKYLP